MIKSPLVRTESGRRRPPRRIIRVAFVVCGRTWLLIHVTADKLIADYDVVDS